ncbi:hypothetical protein ACJRO7_029877 [Eucalyptus globulus]|uniref:aminobutyraldehyde dehydrogenase n=1 Tax=Eucalyptus globulus TaxID=34317 RepID=A0ABD3JKM4_EUCGL
MLDFAALVATNHPLLMATWKVAPTLAAGCTTILKPSELASMTCLELAEVYREVGLPPGVLNILTGLGHKARNPLASHPQVDKIAFTGSSATRSKIMTVVAQLVKEIDSAHGQVWDTVLVNKCLGELRVAQKLGRKERKHKEAQADRNKALC